MRANKATFVYTPQVLLQGRDFPGWREGALRSSGARASLRVLRTHARRGAVGNAVAVQVNAEVTDAALRADVQLLRRLCGQRIASPTSGGRKPRHTPHARARCSRAAAGGRADGRGRVNASVDFARPREPGRSRCWWPSCSAGRTATCCRRSRCRSLPAAAPEAASEAGVSAWRKHQIDLGGDQRRFGHEHEEQRDEPDVPIEHHTRRDQPGEFHYR